MVPILCLKFDTNVSYCRADVGGGDTGLHAVVNRNTFYHCYTNLALEEGD